jgi:predicted metal-dependent hydrolase
MSTNASATISTRTVQFGSRDIEYQLHRDDCRRLSITVLPMGSVRVRAPDVADEEEIDQRVLRRARWILKQIRELDALRPLQPEWEFVSGETHRYLGRQYRLRVRQGKPTPTRLRGKFFEITVKDSSDRNVIANSLETWYRQQATRLITKMVAAAMDRPPLDGIPTPTIQLRKMSCRWGSCTSNKRILFNPLLIRTPRQCVRYVVAHELSHLVSLRHDKKFFRTLEQLEPRWQELRVQLNEAEI